MTRARNICDDVMLVGMVSEVDRFGHSDCWECRDESGSSENMVLICPCYIVTILATTCIRLPASNKWEFLTVYFLSSLLCELEPGSLSIVIHWCIGFIGGIH